MLLMGRALETKCVASLNQRRLIYPLILQQKVFYVPNITNKMEHFSFKSGRIILVAKRLMEDWFVVLQ